MATVNNENGSLIGIYIGKNKVTEINGDGLELPESKSPIDYDLETSILHKNHWKMVGNIELLTNKETGLIFYLKRGNKYYFRSKFGRRIFVFDNVPCPEEFKSMKYGTKCDITWSCS